MNYGKKSTQKREKELTSKSTMIRKKFYVIFCKSLLVCVFAVMVIGACSGVGVIRGIIASAPTIDDIVATPTGFLSTVLDANGNQTATLVASGSNRRAVTIDEIPKNLQDEYERMKHQCCDKGKNEIIDSIVEEGVREGLIREENVFLRRAAVETQLSVYFMYRIAAEKKMELDLEADSLREYIYQNLLKLLG